MASAATTPNQGPGDRTTLPYAVSHATQENDPNVLAGVSDVKQAGEGGANQCVIWGSVFAIAGSGSLGPGL